MDCITNIVGVTNKTDLPYYSELSPDMQAAIALSTSGLYIDTLTGGIDLRTIDTADYMTLALQYALDAKPEAEKVFKDDLLVAVNNRYAPAKVKFNGLIGKRSFSANLPVGADNQGHRYRVYQPIAGNITINRIGVALSGVATFNVYVSRCEAGAYGVEELLYTFPVTTTFGLFADADLSSQNGQIVLPMQINGVAQEYYIFYKRSEANGLLAKNNEIKCGCSGDKGMRALDSYMHYDGVSINDMDNLRSVSADRKGHGISVSSVVGCEHSVIICREYEKKEAVSLMMQWAVLYKTGELWIEYLLKSGYINRDSMQNREYFLGKRNHFKSEYEQRITAIANGMTLGETNCYVCKDDTMTLGTIYS